MLFVAGKIAEGAVDHLMGRYKSSIQFLTQVGTEQKEWTKLVG
jgi:hypothetical protein